MLKPMNCTLEIGRLYGMYFNKAVKKRIYDVQFLNCNILYHEGESIESGNLYFSPIYHVIPVYIVPPSLT